SLHRDPRRGGRAQAVSRRSCYAGGVEGAVGGDPAWRSGARGGWDQARQHAPVARRGRVGLRSRRRALSAWAIPRRDFREAGRLCPLVTPPAAGLAEIASLDCQAPTGGAALVTTWHAQHHSTVDAAAKALGGKRINSLEIHGHEDVHEWHPGQQWIWAPGGF